MAAPGTIGYLVGKLDVLRASARAAIDPAATVAKLVTERGPHTTLTDWLSERARDCPQKNQAGVVRACDAIMPDLIGL
jgi:hypothetical protein